MECFPEDFTLWREQLNISWVSKRGRKEVTWDLSSLALVVCCPGGTSVFHTTHPPSASSKWATCRSQQRRSIQANTAQSSMWQVSLLSCLSPRPTAFLFIRLPGRADSLHLPLSLGFLPKRPLLQHLCQTEVLGIIWISLYHHYERNQSGMLSQTWSCSTEGINQCQLLHFELPRGQEARGDIQVTAMGGCFILKSSM